MEIQLPLNVLVCMNTIVQWLFICCLLTIEYFTAATVCPETHFQSLGGGEYCCEHSLKVSNVSGNAACDGTAFTTTDATDCCTTVIDCPNKPCADACEFIPQTLNNGNADIISTTRNVT